jgi:8-oxo-dGTP diphosphatase
MYRLKKEGIIMKQINTVGGLIVNKEGKILCTERGESKYDYISFKWEFPGGKVEEGETDEETLRRELMEELEIEVDVIKPFYQVEHTYPDFHLSMPVYLCKLKSKDMKLMVHKSIKWLKPNEMMSLDWAAADIPVAQVVFDMSENFNKEMAK